MAYRIATIPGDGIGSEVVEQALRVLEATGVEAQPTYFNLGAARYNSTGEVLPDAELEDIRGYDAILLGAVGDPSVPPGVLERGLLLKLRFGLDHHVNLRPVKLYPGVATPLAGKGPGHIDMVVCREGTEGPYVGAGGAMRVGTPQEIAVEESLNTRFGVERIVRDAFARASRRRGKVTLVHKTNVLTNAGSLWQRTFDEVAEQYPQVSTGYDHIDAACIHFVERPERYDVIVTDNLFGDILTDLGGAVAGGVGYAASANLNPARTGPSMFEPVHGTAPDIAGQNKANPIAAIISLQLMLDFLGEADAAAAVAAACDNPERYTGSTTDIGDAVAAAVRSA